MTIHEMKIGQQASFTKTVSESDVYLFAGITGDMNPAHTNQVASEKTFSRAASRTECSVQASSQLCLACICPARGRSTWDRN